jgi:hypothetical protein
MMRIGVAVAEIQHLGEDALDRRLVGLDFLDGAHRPGLVLAGRIANHRRAAAHQRDGLVAGLLQPVQHHQGEEVADMKRRRGAIISDIGDHLVLRRQRVETLEIRALVDETAFVENVQEIGLVTGHVACLHSWEKAPVVFGAARL